MGCNPNIFSLRLLGYMFFIYPILNAILVKSHMKSHVFRCQGKSFHDLSPTQCSTCPAKSGAAASCGSRFFSMVQTRKYGNVIGISMVMIYIYIYIILYIYYIYVYICVSVCMILCICMAILMWKMMINHQIEGHPIFQQKKS